MKIRVTMDLDVPEEYFLDGEYHLPSIQQTMWDHTVKELEIHNLHWALKTATNPALTAAQVTDLVAHYERWAAIFRTSEYKIEKL